MKKKGINMNMNLSHQNNNNVEQDRYMYVLMVNVAASINHSTNLQKCHIKNLYLQKFLQKNINIQVNPCLNNNFSNLKKLRPLKPNNHLNLHQLQRAQDPKAHLYQEHKKLAHPLNNHLVNPLLLKPLQVSLSKKINF